VLGKLTFEILMERVVCHLDGTIDPIKGRKVRCNVLGLSDTPLLLSSHVEWKAIVFIISMRVYPGYPLVYGPSSLTISNHLLICIDTLYISNSLGHDKFSHRFNLGI
jgi:hypothetical protein